MLYYLLRHQEDPGSVEGGTYPPRVCLLVLHEPLNDWAQHLWKRSTLGRESQTRGAGEDARTGGPV